MSEYRRIIRLLVAGKPRRMVHALQNMHPQSIQFLRFILVGLRREPRSDTTACEQRKENARFLN